MPESRWSPPVAAAVGQIGEHATGGWVDEMSLGAVPANGVEQVAVSAELRLT